MEATGRECSLVSQVKRQMHNCELLQVEIQPPSKIFLDCDVFQGLGNCLFEVWII